MQGKWWKEIWSQILLSNTLNYPQFLQYIKYQRVFSYRLICGSIPHIYLCTCRYVYTHAGIPAYVYIMWYYTHMQVLYAHTKRRHNSRCIFEVSFTHQIKGNLCVRWWPIWCRDNIVEQNHTLSMYCESVPDGWWYEIIKPHFKPQTLIISTNWCDLHM